MVDIDGLSGRELDALVAQRVMGSTIDESRRAADGSPMMLHELPRYSENPGLAHGIEFTLEQRHPGTALRIDSRAPFQVVIRGPSGREYAASDPSEATAICRAMLKVMDGEGPGIPRDQVPSSREPRAISAVADLLAAKVQPHQRMGITMQAFALEHGTYKEGPMQALLGYAVSAQDVVPVVAGQLAADRDIALGCVEILNHLAQAGDAARVALEAAQTHANPDIAKAAAKALHEPEG